MYMQVPAVPWTEVYGQGLRRASTVFLWDHIFKLIKSSCYGVELIFYRELSTASRLTKMMFSEFWPLCEQFSTLFMSFHARVEPPKKSMRNYVHSR